MMPRQTALSVPWMVSEIKAMMPVDFYPVGCLRIPLEEDDEAFPYARFRHPNCTCQGCRTEYVAVIQRRAALVRGHIAAGRQHMLV